MKDSEMGKVCVAECDGKKFHILLAKKENSRNLKVSLSFSEKEMEELERVSFPFIQDEMDFGIIYDAVTGKEKTKLIKVKYDDGTVLVLKISEEKLEKAITKTERKTNSFDS